MPELPEVEVMCANVTAWALGGRVSGLEVLDLSVLVVRPESAAAGEAFRSAGQGDARSSTRWAAGEGDSGVAAPREGSLLEGCSLERVRRRAKYLLMDFQGGWTLVTHCRMTGQWVRASAGGRARARLHFHDREPLHFRDTRRFAELRLLRREAAEAYLAERRLGPEPWPEARSGVWWRERLGDARIPLKRALMEQRRVAGLGNIAASEICWEAGLLPDRDCRLLDEGEWSRIADATHGYLERVIAMESGRELVFVNEGARTHPTPFRIYRREGAPCPRCSGTLRRAKEGGRATFYCRGCQF